MTEECKCGIARADCTYHRPEPKYAGVYGVDPCDSMEERFNKLSRLFDSGTIDREQFIAWLDNPPDDSGAFLREPSADVYELVYESIDQHGRVVRYGTLPAPSIPSYSFVIRL